MAFSHLNSTSGPAAGSRDADLSLQAEDIFVGRQPILNNQQKICAYELLFRSGSGAPGAVFADDVQATARVLINTFNNMGVERVFGEKRAFVNISEKLLFSDVLAVFPRDKIVLELLEHIKPTPEVAARCRELAAAGFQLALDDFVYSPAFEPLLATAAYVKMDLRALGMRGVSEHVQLLRGRSLRLLAEKVETYDEFQACRRMMINYYQGYYFAKPETLRMKRIDPSAMRVMQIFNLVVGRAEPAEIEAEFKHDVALSFNLLRYINSVGFDLLHKVKSVGHALTLLGRARLSNWLSLLLMSVGRAEAPPALFKTALMRARFMELLGKHTGQSGGPENLFMTGMFSLLDVLLDMPLEQSLGSMSLPEPVSAALLRGEGPHAPYLALARASEMLDVAAVQRLAAILKVDLDAINQAACSALAWAEELESRNA